VHIQISMIRLDLAPNTCLAKYLQLKVRRAGCQAWLTN